jgi:hypothetical protein
MYGVQPSYFITHVNGTSVFSLDDFEKMVKGVSEGEYVRIKCLTFDCIPTIVSVKMNKHYFGGVRYVREGAGEEWRREAIE